MDVIKYMNHAEVTLIGYDSISEKKVDISTFCDQSHSIDFINSSENSIPLIRDLKILNKGGQQIIYEAQFIFNVVDNNIKVVKNNIYSYLPKSLWAKKEY